MLFAYHTRRVSAKRESSERIVFPACGMAVHWLIFVLSLVSLWFFNRSGSAQGTIVFNNLGRNDGLVFVSTGPSTAIPLDRDINFELRVFTVGDGSLVLSRSWLLSDGTATGINVGPGLFADPSNSVIVLPEIVPGTPVAYFVRAWSGNYPTFFDAVDANAPVGGAGATLRTGSIDEPPASLTGMLTITIAAIPEPRILSLGIIGVGVFFFGRFCSPPASLRGGGFLSLTGRENREDLLGNCTM